MNPTAAAALFAWITSGVGVDGFLAPVLQSNGPLTQQHSHLASTAASSDAVATELSSVGKAEVDLNQYNLDESLIPEEWTANMKAASELEAAGIYLGAKDPKTNFVDTLKVVMTCPKPGQGLGIELLELAGGRADGLGITMVSGLVAGKAAEASGLLFGDSITQLSLRQRDADGTIKEVFSAPTECLDYDGTIDSILSMLEAAALADTEELSLVFTIKRLRRRPKVQMRLQYPPEQEEDDVYLELFAGENLRRAMLARGVKLNDPLARRFDSGGSGDCGAEGTCATCAVSVLQGLELLNEPGQTEAQIMRDTPRWRMACRAIVGHGMREGELVVRVNPRQWSS